MPWVWQRDDEMVGLVSVAAAARRLGRSPTYVRAMVNQAVLRTQLVGSRTMVDGQTVTALAARLAGHGDLDDRIDALERSSENPHELCALLTERQRAADEAELRDFGHGSPAGQAAGRANQPRTPSDADAFRDPLHDFVRDFVAGGVR